MVATGVFLSTMDSSMTNVALPSIMRSFGSSLPQTEWVVLIYLLTITSSLLFWGSFSDRHGKCTVYLIGMFIFTVGSFACYFAVSLTGLCLFRFVQAIGASMMMATGPAIIKMVYPIRKLGMALGAIGIATSTGLMLGPVISGVLIHNYSWRVIFLVTIPLSSTVFVIGWFWLRPIYMHAEKTENSSATDWPGTILWATLVSAVVFLSTIYSQMSGKSVLASIIVILLLAIIFIKKELKQRTPLLPLILFYRRSYAVAIFCAALSFAVLFVVLILMPFYMDYILNFSAQQIGFVMMSIPLSVFLVSPISGILFDRIGARFLTTAGLGIAASSLLFICLLSENSGAFDIAWRLALLGCGQALFLSPNSADVLASVDSDQVGISSGLLATARNLGMLTGVTLAGLLFGAIFSKLTDGLDLKQFQPEQAGSFMTALIVTFGITAVLSLFGAVLSGLRRTRN